MTARTPEVDLQQLAAALDDGASVVDVREANEYVAGQVPGAVLMPSTSSARRATAAPR